MTKNIKSITYKEALRLAMERALERNPKAIIMGQGIDDHKGFFGTTLGLQQKFGPHRVMDTPIAEEGMTGIAIGAALNGLYPIMTHIRADFSILAMNQIVNLAAKYKYMSGGEFQTPLLIRAVIGRSWGQGAQHSQSFQSLFSHIPGLTVIMPSEPSTILSSYAYATEKFKGPVISFEHRLMYDLNFNDKSGEAKKSGNPFTSRLVRKGKHVTIVATSIMVLEAQRAAAHLAQFGIQCEVIDLNCISSPNHKLIFDSVKKTGKLLVADSSWIPFGVCAEVNRIICERDPRVLKAPVVNVGMAFAPCPTAKSLEDIFYPNLRTLSESIAQLVTGKRKHGIKLPTESSMADVYKRFKGPF